MGRRSNAFTEIADEVGRREQQNRDDDFDDRSGLEDQLEDRVRIIQGDYLQICAVRAFGSGRGRRLSEARQAARMVALMR